MVMDSTLNFYMEHPKFLWACLTLKILTMLEIWGSSRTGWRLKSLTIWQCLISIYLKPLSILESILSHEVICCHTPTFVIFHSSHPITQVWNWSVHIHFSVLFLSHGMNYKGKPLFHCRHLCLSPLSSVFLERCFPPRDLASLSLLLAALVSE